MLWKNKKKQTQIVSKLPKITNSSEKDITRAAKKLAESLNAYSTAAYDASIERPNAKLTEARIKTEAARTIFRDGRLGYALGKCIPEHVKYWHSWSEREDFLSYVKFNASDIKANYSEEKSGSRTAKTSHISFNFNGSDYELVFRKLGQSYIPESTEYDGEIELSYQGSVVAKIDIVEDYMNEYSTWEYRDVKALKVGPWMKDILEIATQIEISERNEHNNFMDKLTLETAKNIDLS